MFARRFILIAALCMAIPAEAQSPSAVSTYKIHAAGVVKGWGGAPFEWILAPDNSLLISLRQSNGRWSIKRITNWQTRSPKEETINFVDGFEDRKGSVYGRPLLVDAAGKYLVFRVVHFLSGTNEASRRNRHEAVIAVIDLRTFNLVSKVSIAGALASGDLDFNDDGMLTVRNIKYDYPAKQNRQAILLSLPKLETIASCDYIVEYAEAGKKESVLTDNTCPALLASTLQKLASDPRDPPFDPKFESFAGPQCWDVELNRARTLALLRCGREHFTDPDGLFGITFWKALKVLSVPDGKTLFSLPLHFYDGNSWGLFAEANGHEYLIVRHGLALQTYQLP